MATVASHTRWKIVVYPWDSQYPTPTSQSLPALDVSKWVRALSFTRAKATPSNTLNLQIVGPVHWAVMPGNWVVVKSSAEQVTVLNQEIQMHDLVRFIGQISSVHTEYSSDPDGNVRKVTTAIVREWSDMLNMRVRLDELSLTGALASGSNAGALGFATSLTAGSSATREDYVKVASSQFNPFEFAQLVLRLIGAINDLDIDNQSIKQYGVSRAELATRLPKIPKSLLEDLGLMDVDEDDPFSSSFVKTIFGVQLAPILNTGTWSGIFPPNFVAGMTLATPGNPFFLRNPPNRPVTFNLATLLWQGLPAWQLLSQQTDPAVNEVFTDFVYEFSLDGGVSSQPVIVLRDKPFALKKLYDEGSFSALDRWTIYDDLPRIALKLEHVTRMVVSNTFVEAPNFIRLNYTSFVFDQNKVQYQTQLTGGGPIRKADEQARFGGHEAEITTTFLSINTPTSTEPGNNVIINPLAHNTIKWYESLRSITDIWHTHLYKMANLSLILKDAGVPLTVGFNAQIKVGERDLVGHIESIATDVGVDETGNQITTTRVELSHVVQVGDDGKLDFIPIPEMFSLLGETIQAPASVTAGGGLGALGNIPQAVGPISVPGSGGGQLEPSTSTTKLS